MFGVIGSDCHEKRAFLTGFGLEMTTVLKGDQKRGPGTLRFPSI